MNDKASQIKDDPLLKGINWHYIAQQGQPPSIRSDAIRGTFDQIAVIRERINRIIKDNLTASDPTEPYEAHAVDIARAPDEMVSVIGVWNAVKPFDTAIHPDVPGYFAIQIRGMSKQAVEEALAISIHDAAQTHVKSDVAPRFTDPAPKSFTGRVRWETNSGHEPKK